MVGRFRGCEHSVTATIKHIAEKCENRFDKFPGVRFMSSDVPSYSRNIDKETEVKTNLTCEPGTIEPVNGYN